VLDNEYFIQEWLINGQYSRRNNQPHYTKTDNRSLVVEEQWRNLSGRLHREGDLPALVRRDPESGNVILTMWWREGEAHRNPGPAIVWHRTDSPMMVDREIWVEDGMFQRTDDPDEPTYLAYNREGKVQAKQWFVKDVFQDVSIMPPPPQG